MNQKSKGGRYRQGRDRDTGRDKKKQIDGQRQTEKAEMAEILEMVEITEIAEMAEMAEPGRNKQMRKCSR